MTLGIIMIQREVADRLTASPGGRDFGPLTVIVQALCEVERLMTLSPGCFWPQPRVDSAVLRVVRRPVPLTDNPHRLAQLTQRLFQQRRKQIGSILGRDAPLPPGVEATFRPEQLTVEQLVALASDERLSD
jgi:16S rRNA (adenine1518-N6/adenine1519-N6)-dimethyltransferase